MSVQIYSNLNYDDQYQMQYQVQYHIVSVQILYFIACL